MHYLKHIQVWEHSKWHISKALSPARTRPSHLSILNCPGSEALPTEELLRSEAGTKGVLCPLIQC